MWEGEEASGRGGDEEKGRGNEKRKRKKWKLATPQNNLATWNLKLQTPISELETNYATY